VMALGALDGRFTDQNMFVSFDKMCL
jgi:hypothetical protein